MDEIRCAECYYRDVCRPIKDDSVRANCSDFKQGYKREEHYWKEMSYYQFREKSTKQRLREGE